MERIDAESSEDDSFSSATFSPRSIDTNLKSRALLVRSRYALKTQKIKVHPQTKQKTKTNNEIFLIIPEHCNQVVLSRAHQYPKD